MIDRGGRFELFEAKWTENPSAADANALQLLRKLLGERSILRQSIVCRARNRYPVAASTEAITIDDL